MSKKCFDRGERGTLCIDRQTGEQTWHKPDGPSDGPSLLRKAANFTGAMVKHVATGRNKVSLDVIQETFRICSNCPDNMFRLLGEDEKPRLLKDVEPVGVCKHIKCGCYIHSQLTFPNKLELESQKCPLGHWSNRGKELRDGT